MALRLDFDFIYHYDTSKIGITIPVLLGQGDNIVEVDAKLDCGSTYCVFERQWGEALGLNIERGHPQRISTATGSFLAYGHQITFSVFEVEFESVFYFAADESFNRNVLGQRGFLDRIVCGLDDYQGRFYLRSNA